MYRRSSSDALGGLGQHPGSASSSYADGKRRSADRPGSGSGECRGCLGRAATEVARRQVGWRRGLVDSPAAGHQGEPAPWQLIAQLNSGQPRPLSQKVAHRVVLHEHDEVAPVAAADVIVDAVEQRQQRKEAVNDAVVVLRVDRIFLVHVD